MEQEQTGVARCPLCRSDNTRYRRSVPGAQAGITSIVVRAKSAVKANSFEKRHVRTKRKNMCAPPGMRLSIEAPGRIPRDDIDLILYHLSL